MLVLLLILVITTLCVTALAYSHYKLLFKLRNKYERYATILYEDVILRLQESEDSNSSLEALRKVREAHASLETLSGIIGGFQVLGEATEIDINLLDKNISDRERDIRNQIKSNN
jgi:hypothetical protein